jgi:hypothetical protein
VITDVVLVTVAIFFVYAGSFLAVESKAVLRKRVGKSKNSSACQNTMKLMRQQGGKRRIGL